VVTKVTTAQNETAQVGKEEMVEKEKPLGTGITERQGVI
jgi:hypothetical protein